MTLQFLTVQQALDYIETLYSDEFSADQCNITGLPPDTDEEKCNENYLDEIEPVDVCGEVELNFKQCETLKKIHPKRGVEKSILFQLMKITLIEVKGNKQHKKSTKNVVKWKGNKIVCLASNFECMEQTALVPKTEKKTNLLQPRIVGSHKNMGGVDLLESLLTKNKGCEMVVAIFYQHSEHG
ncbi:hypothetical protein NPIL_460751 [Nephila pilipes]|uniref:Uncharacterized protein n=1 Tax=Nephila pilipes TaxID=299642 RepID=A0A8X6TZB9_NEPPI|nr:hypothetical protein NPIL_460751 [Nephila pilipes]